jgi:hypothetical protein
VYLAVYMPHASLQQTLHEWVDGESLIVCITNKYFCVAAAITHCVCISGCVPSLLLIVSSLSSAAKVSVLYRAFKLVLCIVRFCTIEKLKGFLP